MPLALMHQHDRTHVQAKTVRHIVHTAQMKMHGMVVGTSKPDTALRMQAVMHTPHVHVFK